MNIQIANLLSNCELNKAGIAILIDHAVNETLDRRDREDREEVVLKLILAKGNEVYNFIKSPADINVEKLCNAIKDTTYEHIDSIDSTKVEIQRIDNINREVTVKYHYTATRYFKSEDKPITWDYQTTKDNTYSCEKHVDDISVTVISFDKDIWM